VLESVALALVRGNAARMAVAVHRPDAGLLTALRETRRPFLLALDDPRLLVTTEDSIGSLRDVANLCPLLTQLADLPNALQVSADVIRDTPNEVLCLIADHFGFPATHGDLVRVTAALPPLLARQGTQDDTIEGALGPYARFFEGGVPGDILWTRQLFTKSANPAKPLSEPVRLRETFNGRFLIHGPYLALPPGNWSAELAMTVSADGAGQSLVVDAYCGEVLDTLRCVLSAGEFRTPALNFTIGDHYQGAVELRLMAERDAAPGELVLCHAHLRPMPATASQARAGQGGQ